jgi:putative peptidoglycan lipid II flippase
VLAEPITRLVYQRGEFDDHSTHIVAQALFWFSFSLPFSGVNLLLTRTFFSLQRPWLPTGLGAATLLINLAVALVLVGPFGIGGIVVATAVSSAAMTAGQAFFLRRELGGQLEGGETLRAVGRILVASVALSVVAYGLWRGLDALLGRSLPAQIVSVGGGLAAGIAVYCAVVIALRVPEAQQIRELLGARLPRRR